MLDLANTISHHDSLTNWIQLQHWRAEEINIFHSLKVMEDFRW